MRNAERRLQNVESFRLSRGENKVLILLAAGKRDSGDLTREMIAEVLGTDDFSIARSVSGKPALAPPWEGLQFNLTHTRDVTLFAFAWDARVGIDVEWRHRHVNVEPLARRFLSSQERAEILAAPHVPERRERFLRCWTRKEALLKAVGTGLAGGLDKFTVSTGSEARIVACDAGVFGSAETWQLEDLEIDPDYFASVAVERLAGTTWAVQSAGKAVLAGPTDVLSGVFPIGPLQASLGRSS